MKKTLPVYVYRSPLGDCTNGGLSASLQIMCLACPDGWLDVEDDDPRLLRLEARDFHRRKSPPYLVAIPVNPGLPTEKNVGPMFGGNFIWTSDSRFPGDYPIPIHDRWETAEQYDILSR